MSERSACNAERYAPRWRWRWPVPGWRRPSTRSRRWCGASPRRTPCRIGTGCAWSIPTPARPDGTLAERLDDAPPRLRMMRRPTASTARSPRQNGSRRSGRRTRAARPRRLRRAAQRRAPGRVCGAPLAAPRLAHRLHGLRRHGDRAGRPRRALRRRALHPAGGGAGGRYPLRAPPYHRRSPADEWLQAASLRRIAALGYDPSLHGAQRAATGSRRPALPWAPAWSHARRTPSMRCGRTQPPPPLGPISPASLSAFAGARTPTRSGRSIAGRLAEKGRGRRTVGRARFHRLAAQRARRRCRQQPPAALLRGGGRRRRCIDWFVDRPQAHARGPGPSRQRRAGPRAAGYAGRRARSVSREEGKAVLDRRGGDAGLDGRSPRPTAAPEAIRGSRSLASLPKACKNAVELAGIRAAHRRDGAALDALSWPGSRPRPPGSVTELDAVDRLGGDARRGRALPGAELRHHLGRRRQRGDRPLPGDRGDRTARSGGGLALSGRFRRPVPGRHHGRDPHGRHRHDPSPRTATASPACCAAISRSRLARFPRGTSGATARRAGPPVPVAGGARLRPRHGPRRRPLSQRARGAAAHLPPRQRRRRSRPGMIVSNEPGYYETGAYGIRSRESGGGGGPTGDGSDDGFLGFETLTLAPIDRALIEPAMMTADERAWLDAYHARVAAALAPLLADDAATLSLARGTRPRRSTAAESCLARAGRADVRSRRGDMRPEGERHDRNVQRPGADRGREHGAQHDRRARLQDLHGRAGVARRQERRAFAAGLYPRGPCRVPELT